MYRNSIFEGISQGWVGALGISIISQLSGCFAAISLNFSPFFSYQ